MNEFNHLIYILTFFIELIKLSLLRFKFMTCFDISLNHHLFQKFKGIKINEFIHIIYILSIN